ncbi:MAG: diguanylate cyclase [Flexilinea sp.]
MSILDKKNGISKDFLELFLLIVFLFTILLAGILLIDFSQKIGQQTGSENELLLREISLKNVNIIKTRLNDSLLFLNNCAGWYSELSENKSADRRKTLASILHEGNFDELSFADSEGMMYSTDYAVGDASSYKSYQQAMQGNSSISEITPYSGLNDQMMIGLASLVLDSTGIPKGVLYGFYSKQHFAEIIDSEISDGKSFTNIINKDGDYISISDHVLNVLPFDNYWKNIEAAQFEKEYNREDIRKNIAGEKSGLTLYSIAGITQYTYYEPIEISGWYAITKISKEALEENTDKINDLAAGLTSKIFSLLVIAILAAIFWMYIFQKRIIHANRELVLSEQRFRIAASQTASRIFDYDILVKQISYTQDGSKMIINISDSDFPGKLLRLNALPVHESKLIKDMFRNIDVGIETESCIVSSGQSDEMSQWNKIKLTGIRDEDGNPIYAIGTIEDISNQKQVEMDLLTRAEHDSLTGLFNRKAAIQRINRILNDASNHILLENEVHAIMLVDVDNFKLVNDTLGHVIGDQLLINIADLLQKSFRKTDSICRLGGDEFLIFLPKMVSHEVVEKKAYDFCIEANRFNLEGKNPVSVSCSVGLAFYPQDGKSFQELYQKADKALYYAKRHGKNRYAVYNNSIESGIVKKTEIRTDLF